MLMDEEFLPKKEGIKNPLARYLKPYILAPEGWRNIDSLFAISPVVKVSGGKKEALLSPFSMARRLPTRINTSKLD